MENLPYLTPTLLSIFLLVFAILFIKNKSQTKISTENTPPGPRKLPLIGNLHQLLCLLPHRRLFDLSKTYGPIMHHQLGQVSSLTISSPILAEQIFKHHDINFSERCRVSVTSILFYNRKDISFAPYGEHWRQMRKISMIELFSSKRVESFKSIREEEVLGCVRSVILKVGSQINVSKLVFSLSQNIFTRIVIGSKSESQEELLPLIHRVVKAVAGFTLVDVLPSLDFIHVISGMKYRLVKLHKEVDKLLEDIINDHKTKVKQGETGDNNKNSLVDVLLSLQENSDFPLTNDTIKAIILDLFIAGIDTTATIIEWAMSELIKHPRVMKKVQEELRMMHIKHDNILDETRSQEFKYLKAVIKETLRLHPPIPLIPRQCREKCRINGYDINPKTEVLINAWAIGRDPSYWTQPEEFYPERFIGSEVDYKGFNFELIPFGSGRRICPGMLLGTATVEFILMQLLYHFNWESCDEVKPESMDMTEAFSTVVRRKNDLHIIPTLYHCPMSL